jgi:deazaflavin-dependent oxidoreductase (nitroreductase family)
VRAPQELEARQDLDVTRTGPGPVLRRLLRAPVLLYGAGLGPLLGQRFLMLTHVGRRSGRVYRTVVEVVGRLPHEDAYVVMAGFGHSAGWLRNLQAGGGREVAVGRRRFRPSVRELGEEEASATLASYERRNRLAAPVVRVVLSRLVGWRYTGTGPERARLVRELPLVALSPAGEAAG